MMTLYTQKCSSLLILLRFISEYIIYSLKNGMSYFLSIWSYVHVVDHPRNEFVPVLWRYSSYTQEIIFPIHRKSSFLNTFLPTLETPSFLNTSTFLIHIRLHEHPLFKAL